MFWSSRRARTMVQNPSFIFFSKWLDNILIDKITKRNNLFYRKTQKNTIFSIFNIAYLHEAIEQT